MNERMIQKSSLIINDDFKCFIDNEVLPLTLLDADKFWLGVQTIIHEFNPRNRALLEKRDEIQLKIDQWHQENNYLLWRDLN